MFRLALYVFVSLCCFTPHAFAAGGIRHLADMNTEEIRALDRAKTVVLLPGGILEEHGPYLPAYTDGILSERLTDELARAIAAKKPDWTVLLFPQIAVGASGSNELGGHFTFSGTYAVRPSTLRAVFMDVASELGDQGFRWLFVVHVHGAPLHNRALDQAGDYFHDVYGGRMVHLWGLIPVLGGWGKAMQGMSDEQKKEDGVSLHAGADEHSLLLHLRPDLVSPKHKEALVVAGATRDEAFEKSKAADWPGYLGSPRVASKELGLKIWRGLADAAIEHAFKILDGADPAQFARYADYLAKVDRYKGWIDAAAKRDDEIDAKQAEWLKKSAK